MHAPTSTMTMMMTMMMRQMTDIQQPSPPPSVFPSFSSFELICVGKRRSGFVSRSCCCLEGGLGDFPCPCPCTLAVLVAEGGFGFFISLIMANFCFFAKSFSSLVFRSTPNASFHRPHMCVDQDHRKEIRAAKGWR